MPRDRGDSLRDKVRARVSYESEELVSRITSMSCDFLDQFVTAILHGDDGHRAWLLQAAAQFKANGTVPPAPKGEDDAAG